MIRRRKFIPFTLEYLELRCLLSAGSSEFLQPDLTLSPFRMAGLTNPSIQGYTPSQIAQGYGFNQITDQGQGQTIAIVDAYKDPNIASDLNMFDAEFGLPSPPLFTQVNQSGGSVSSVLTDPGWSLEISLDVEWAHAVAPEANILLVNTNNDSLKSLVAGVNYARNASDVSVVSMSWGGSEFPNELAYDSYFTTPAGHNGVTFVAASGDSGGYYGPEWPSVSPNVVGVGGTSLDLSVNGSYMQESAWSDSSGGYSIYENEPSYQESAQQSGARTTPDVAYNANPNTGYAVYDSLSYQGIAGWQEIGGTSSATPQWAGLIAIADQERVASGQGTLDGATQTLPLLYGLYSPPGTGAYVTYTEDFHDVTRGSSSFFTRAGLGYDLVTGLGSPMVESVTTALATDPVPTAQTFRTALPTGGRKRHETIFASPVSEPGRPSVVFASVASPNIDVSIVNTDISTPSTTVSTATTSLYEAGPVVESGLVYSGATESHRGAIATRSVFRTQESDELGDEEMVSAKALGLLRNVWTLSASEAGHLAGAIAILASQKPSPAAAGPWKLMDSPNYTKSLVAFIGGAVLVGVWYADRARRTKVAQAASAR
jgi:subtilase family serine protease